MKLDVKSERTNQLMRRREIVIDILNPEEPTPSRASLQSVLADHFRTEKTSVEVVKVKTHGGTPKSTAEIFVWDEKKVPDLSAPKEEGKGKTSAEPKAEGGS